MTSHEVLESVAKSLATTGIYKDETAAIKALAVEQIERKIATYQGQVEAFEEKYQHPFEQHSDVLQGQATMADEEEWMEWKGAVVMRDAWRTALQDVLTSAS